MKIILLFLLFFVSLFAQSRYMDNHACKECHEGIYEEYQHSMHAKTYFNDELHRKVADKADPNRYECAVCHMPMADNLEALVSGKARPDRHNKTHTDAISCYFCHTIAYVKKAHRYNVNTKARQAENYKPTLFGRLVNPDESDKHSSVSNPVYAKQVCTGCHSHKLNEHNVTIFKAMDQKQDSLSCIKCHMPEVAGGAEKMDKRARGQHASHRFLGIHDKAFRKTGIDINVTAFENRIEVTLYNKMTHPLIIQPARAKFLKIEIVRNKKVIWRNYQTDPSEDKQGYFAYSFKKNGKTVIIPATATEGSVNNLNTKEKRVLQYNVPLLEKGDVITVSLYVQLAKSDCARVIKLEDKSLMEPSLIKNVTLKL